MISRYLSGVTNAIFGLGLSVAALSIPRAEEVFSNGAPLIRSSLSAFAAGTGLVRNSMKFGRHFKHLIRIGPWAIELQTRTPGPRS